MTLTGTVVSFVLKPSIGEVIIGLTVGGGALLDVPGLVVVEVLLDVPEPVGVGCCGNVAAKVNITQIAAAPKPVMDKLIRAAQSEAAKVLSLPFPFRLCRNL